METEGSKDDISEEKNRTAAMNICKVYSSYNKHGRDLFSFATITGLRIPENENTAWVGLKVSIMGFLQQFSRKLPTRILRCCEKEQPQALFFTCLPETTSRMFYAADVVKF